MMNGRRHMERTIARCRVVLSLVAIAVVYVDPQEPMLARLIPFASGPFTMDPRLMAAMAAHLAYSLTIHLGFDRFVTPRVAAMTTWIDVAFGFLIGAMTESMTGPLGPFLAFAVITTGLRSGVRSALSVTAASLAFYLGLILVSAHGHADVSAMIMRPAYLAIGGYVVAVLGQQRLELQDQMRRYDMMEQRNRIAIDLHDGCVQTLAAMNLQLEGCRRLLQANEVPRVLSTLREVQDSSKREFDHLRAYARSLAGVEVTPGSDDEPAATSLSLKVDISGSVGFVDDVIGIAREGMINVRRHARAKTARIDVQTDSSRVSIDIRDDGVGFQNDAAPWSISSRVKQMGGRVEVVGDSESGAHLFITLPRQ